MPDLDIVTEGFCPQYQARFIVPGSKGNTYEVNFDADGATCTCPAFKYSAEEVYDKDCKHVHLVRAHGCFAGPYGDTGPNDYAAHGIVLDNTFGSNVIEDRTCACGGDQLAVRIAV